MAQEISKDTKIKLSLETIISLGFVLVTMTGMWFTLKADIAEAKELPVAPDPEITRIEYDMKDQLIRQTIMTTQEDVKDIKVTLEKIKIKFINNEKVNRMETAWHILISIIFIGGLAYCFLAGDSDTL